MKTILIATDYSKAATNALEYAALLARHVGARLVILNAYILAVPAAATATSLHDVSAQMAARQERLNHLAKETSKAYGIPVVAVSSSCSFLNELNRQVKRLHADLVVMGMKGHSLSRKVFGSTTTAVMRHAQYPVLVVPSEAQFSDLQRIVFAFDYNSLSATHSLSFLKELALRFNSKVQVLHVERGLEEAGKEEVHQAVKQVVSMEMLLSGIRHSYRHLEEADVVTGLQRGLAEYKATLLVMVPHKRGAWYSVLSTSKTRQMAFAAEVPLLILPNQKPATPKKKTKAEVAYSTEEIRLTSATETKGA